MICICLVRDNNIERIYIEKRDDILQSVSGSIFAMEFP